MKNADMPAMPICDANGGVFECVLEGQGTIGMTKREMIAMHMMANMMSVEWFESASKQARVAILAADALLAELEKQGEQQ